MKSKAQIAEIFDQVFAGGLTHAEATRSLGWSKKSFRHHFHNELKRRAVAALEAVDAAGQEPDLLIVSSVEEFGSIYFGGRSFIVRPAGQKYAVGRRVVIAEWMASEGQPSGAIIRCVITVIDSTAPGYVVVGFRHIDSAPECLPFEEIQCVSTAQAAGVKVVGG